MKVPQGPQQPPDCRDENATASAVPMRVGFITPWNQACGLATYAQFFILHLAKHVVAVFAETGCATVGRDETFVKRCWQRVGAGPEAVNYSHLEAEVEKAQLDILHINGHSDFFAQLGFASFLTRVRSRGIKVVVHVHQLFTSRKEHQTLLSMADCIIVHSPENRLEAIANGARPETVVVITIGVDIREDLAGQSKDLLRRKLGLEVQGPLLTSFGFIQPHKGMEAVIEAVLHLRARGITARGLIVGQSRTDQPGSAHYHAALQEAVRTNKLDDCITFVSRYVSDSEVGEYLAASDLVIMNYRSDYYEASAACSSAIGAGAVVMASVAPAMTAFGDAVWHITGGYPAGLSAELLITNPQLCEQVRMNARRYAQANAWPVIGRKIESIYEGLFASIEERPSQGIPAQAVVSPASEAITSPAKTRILMQNRPGTFTHRGGDTVVVERLSQGLKDRGFDVKVDVSGAEDPAQYDLVHLFNFATPEFTTHLGERAKAAGVPFVVTTLYEDLPSFHHQSHAIAIHLMEYVGGGQDRAWLNSNKIDLNCVIPAKRFKADWVAENAAALFTNGAGETAAVQRDFSKAGQIVEVMLGHEVGCMVGPELFEREYGVKDFVLCVGRIETRKNQLSLLKALEDSDLTVVLAAGGFSYQPEYETAVRSFKRKGRTIILDRLSSEMLSSAYAACRIHVLPSWYELPGLVSLEAAAHGKNIVVTRTGTSGDYVGTTAFYCQPWDPDSIYAAISAAFYAPIKEGLVEMATRYTWDKAVDNTISAYEGILKGTSTEVADAPQATPVGGCYDMSVDAKQFETLIEQGEMAAREGDYQRAENILREVEVSDPSSARVLKARGAVSLAQGRIEEAKTFFARAMVMTPHDPNLLTGMGMCIAVGGQPAAAMPIFERVLAETPDHLVALHQLLDSAYQVGAFNRAESALRRYLSVKPQDAAIRFCLAGVLYKQELLSAASAEISRVITERPEHDAARELQVLIAKRTATPPAQQSVSSVVIEPSIKEAASDLSQAPTGIAADYFQQRDENAAEARSLIEEQMDSAELLKRDGKPEEARQALEIVRRTAVFTNAQRERLNCIEAEFHVMDNELMQAEEMYGRVLTANSRNTRALCGKGALAAERQEWMVAQEYFEQALSIDAKQDVGLAGLGLCAMVNNKKERAFELFTQAIASNPENPRALLGVLQLGYPMKKYTEIEKAINSYLELHPANLEMLYSFAGILFAQGKVDQAKLEVEKILIFEPQHSRALELRDILKADKLDPMAVRQ